MPGFYWGAVRASLVYEGTYTPDAPPANGIYSQLVTVEVGGLEVFRTRHVNRNWWAPVQYYQNAQFINQQWANYVWSSAQVVGNVVNPTPTIIGNWTGANNGSPLRSYQHAFFEPAQVGPQPHRCRSPWETCHAIRLQVTGPTGNGCILRLAFNQAKPLGFETERTERYPTPH